MTSLTTQIDRVTTEISNLESVDKSCKELHDKLTRLQKDVSKLDVWSKEQQPVAEGLKVTIEAFILCIRVFFASLHSFFVDEGF